MTTWKRVSFAADCQDDACSVCGQDYAECPCPGPTMDGWEYRDRDGVLEAREIRSDQADQITDPQIRRIATR